MYKVFKINLFMVLFFIVLLFCNTQKVSASVGTYYLFSVCNNSNTFVSVGAFGTIMVSHDGENWTEKQSGTDKWLYNIVWNGNGFIANGNGVIVTSRDGENWTSQDSSFLKIFSINGKLFATSNDGYIYTSEDAVSWKKSTSPINSSFSQIYYNGSTYIGVVSTFQNSEVLIYKSNDGENWTLTFTKTFDPIDYVKKIIWDGKQFVGISYRGKILTSSNGDAWYIMELSDFNSISDALDNIVFNGDKVIVAGERYINTGTFAGNIGIVLTSVDGKSWEEQTEFNNTNKYIDNIEFEGNKILAYGGSKILTSNDGVSWTESNIDIEGEIKNITWNGKTFVAVGQNLNGWGIIYTSNDGNTWISDTINKRGVSIANSSPSSGTYNKPQSVLLGSTMRGNIYYTLDGSNPTSNSKQYSEPIDINNTCTLKYISIDLFGESSPVYTEQYVINIITSIADITATVNQNDSYSLPSTVTATMSDGSIKDVSVVWDNLVVDTSKVGTVTYEGTVDGYGSKVKLTLVVNAKSVLGDLDKDGQVTIADSNLLKSHLIGKATLPADNLMLSDLDGDGKITSSEYALMKRYLLGKITHFPVEGVLISSIADINTTVNQDDSYTLPSTVTATMSDGSTQQISVTWDKQVDTSQAGEFTFNGRVSGYNGNVILTLNVSVFPVTITSIADINATINQNNSYTLPNTVTATMSDGSVKEVPVTWNPSVVDTGKIGIYTFEGTVEGYNGKVVLNLSVGAVDLSPNIYIYNYSMITIDNLSKKLSLNINNMSSGNVIIEKIEVYEEGTLYSTYTSNDLISSGISNSIKSNESWGISISSKLGIWLDNSYIKYYLKYNDKSYEYQKSLSSDTFSYN